MDFDANIPYINKVIFSIGGFFDGYETKTYTFKGDKVHIDIDHSLLQKPSNIGDGEIEPWDKDEFLYALNNLHIGEWRKRYKSKILDGTQWTLDIYFSNGHKPVKIYGNNAYPYNFERLLELLEMERDM